MKILKIRVVDHECDDAAPKTSTVFLELDGVAGGAQLKCWSGIAYALQRDLAACVATREALRQIVTADMSGWCDLSSLKIADAYGALRRIAAAFKPECLLCGADTEAGLCLDARACRLRAIKSFVSAEGERAIKELFA